MFLENDAQFAFDQLGYFKCKLLESNELEEIVALYAMTKNQSGLNKPFYTSIWSDNEEYKREVDQTLKKILIPCLARVCSNFKTVFANFMVKGVGESSALHPHQDWTFVDEEAYQSITVWIPLRNVDKSNGALEVLPKSHRLKNFKRARFLDSPFGHLTTYISDNLMKSITMERGEALFVNSRTIHSSSNNLSEEERIAVSIVIIPIEATLKHFVIDNHQKSKMYELEIQEDFFTRYSCFDYPDTKGAKEYEVSQQSALGKDELLKILE